MSILRYCVRRSMDIHCFVYMLLFYAVVCMMAAYLVELCSVLVFFDSSPGRIYTIASTLYLSDALPVSWAWCHGRGVMGVVSWCHGGGVMV